MISTQVKAIQKQVEVKQRRQLDFSGLSDREKDKLNLFKTYDKERAERAIEEVLGPDTKFINRPICRNGI